MQSGSICGGAALFPLLTSKRYVSTVFPFVMLYMQTVDGNRAHCTFQMPTSLRTKRGVPPRMGMAKIEERVAGLAGLGVEIVLLGTGENLHLLHPRLLQSLARSGVGVEVMDTHAACRTYNILVAEGRKVAAALIL